jgi:hypothetical protein
MRSTRGGPVQGPAPFAHHGKSRALKAKALRSSVDVGPGRVAAPGRSARRPALADDVRQRAYPGRGVHQDVTSAEVWLSDGRRLGFAWYDLRGGRAWSRVVGSVTELGTEPRPRYRALHELRACRAARDDVVDVVVYVNDGRRRRGAHGSRAGLHWHASFCERCSLLTDHLEPFARPDNDDSTEAWQAWKRWRRHSWRPGHPFSGQVRAA